MGLTATIPDADAAADADADADADLIRRVLAGEVALFARLVQRHNQRVYRIARAILRDDAEAEDTVQHAHLTAYRELARFRGEASYGTWLARIAVNEAYGRVRFRQRHVLVALDDAGGESLTSRRATPEDDAYHHELGRLLERHIDGLPASLRVVFVLREVEELDTSATARTLGLSEAAVRVRLHRARTALMGTLTRAMPATTAAFRFDGARCVRITRGVRAALGLPETS